MKAELALFPPPPLTPNRPLIALQVRCKGRTPSDARGRGCRKGHQVRLGWVRLDCLTPTLREKASLHDLIKNSQNKNQVNFNCVKTKNLLQATKNKFICNCVKAVLGNEAVLNMFSCAFPIFRNSSLIFHRISPQNNLNENLFILR